MNPNYKYTNQPVARKLVYEVSVIGTNNHITSYDVLIHYSCARLANYFIIVMLAMCLSPYLQGRLPVVDLLTR